MAYPLYNNQFYMQELQNMRDKIDSQMRQVQQQNQMQQPIPQVTQNFQIAPNPVNNELESKYAENIEDVKKTFVMKTGIFINKDYSRLWIKDVSGNIRTFMTEEVVEMDEKDREIYNLKKQIEEMRGMISNANKSTNADDDEHIEEQKPKRVPSHKQSNAK